MRPLAMNHNGRTRQASMPPRNVFWHGRVDVDDGPDPVFTEKVLNALDQVSVKATFFVVGDQIRKQQTP